MLSKMVIKIFEKGKSENVDLLTAKDLIFSDEPENKNLINEAGDVIRCHYDELVDARKKGDIDRIEKICENYIRIKENSKK